LDSAKFCLIKRILRNHSFAFHLARRHRFSLCSLSEAVFIIIRRHFSVVLSKPPTGVQAQRFRGRRFHSAIRIDVLRGRPAGRFEFRRRPCMPKLPGGRGHSVMNGAPFLANIYKFTWGPSVRQKIPGASATCPVCSLGEDDSDRERVHYNNNYYAPRFRDRLCARYTHVACGASSKTNMCISGRNNHETFLIHHRQRQPSLRGVTSRLFVSLPVLTLSDEKTVFHDAAANECRLHLRCITNASPSTAAFASAADVYRVVQKVSYVQIINKSL